LGTRCGQVVAINSNSVGSPARTRRPLNERVVTTRPEGARGMLIIFGFRRKVARLAVVFSMCGFCHTPAAHPVTRIRRYFTLFFIPLIPVGTKYTTTCTLCGRSALITKETADGLVASAQQATAATPPSPPTEQGPYGAASALDTGNSAPGDTSTTTPA